MDPLITTALVLFGLGVLAKRASRSVPAAAIDAAINTYVKVQPGMQLSREATYAQFGGFGAYIQFLSDNFEARKTALRSVWTRDQLLAATKAAAKVAGLNQEAAGALWGIVLHESGGGKSVGITAGGDVQDAIDLNSTAYGVGQVTLSTFQAVKGKVDWNHWDLWHPALGAIVAGWVLNAKLKAAGGDLKTALKKYAGNENTTLIAYAEKYGGEVG
jgi:hypothetical protein